MEGEISFYSWAGESRRLGPPIPFETEEMRAQVMSKIQSLYHAGVALITKDGLRDIHRQIKAFKEIEKISVTGLDGVKVEFDVETGQTREAGDPDLEFILQAPHVIRYESFQALTTRFDFAQPHLAYCNLQIYHRMMLRNKLTKELINSLPVKPYGDTEQFFKTSVQAWENSETCKRLRSTLSQSTASMQQINKAVALACGPISTGSSDPVASRAAFQHALLLTLKEVLGDNKQGNDRITCYAQDPAYADIDRAVLKEAGISTLNDPEAFLEIDESSAVVSCAPDIPVREIVSEIARPAIMIWNPVRADKQLSLVEGKWVPADPVTPRVVDMIRNHYKEFEFPHDEEHFGNVAIYIRQKPV